MLSQTTNSHRHPHSPIGKNSLIKSPNSRYDSSCLDIPSVASPNSLSSAKYVVVCDFVVQSHQRLKQLTIFNPMWTLSSFVFPSHKNLLICRVFTSPPTHSCSSHIILCLWELDLVKVTHGSRSFF